MWSPIKDSSSAVYVGISFEFGDLSSSESTESSGPFTSKCFYAKFIKVRHRREAEIVEGQKGLVKVTDSRDCFVKDFAIRLLYQHQKVLL